MLALMGHMSRSMLERYSHIRMAAKRDAVEALVTRPKARNRRPSPQKSPQLKARPKSISLKLLKLMVSAVGIEPTTY